MPTTVREVASVRVVGLGNVLVGDAAFGPYTVRTLAASYAFTPEVAVIDAGSPGRDLTAQLRGASALIAIDTLEAEGEPGEILLYRKEQILRLGAGLRANAGHGIRESLMSLELQEQCPTDVLLIAAIPHRIETGVGLSSVVRRAIEPAIAEVLRELDRLGLPTHARPSPGTPDIWWEKPIIH